MKTIALLVPTRGRPDNVVLQVQALEETAYRGRWVVLYGVDDDDVALPAELAWAEVRGPRTTMANWTQRLYETFPEFDIYGSIGDDHVPRTRGWDEHVRMAVEQGAHVVGVNDLYPARRPGFEEFPTAWFMTHEALEAVGGFNPPGVKHMFIDNYWWAISRMAGCYTYLADVVFEHMHPLVGKTAWDEGYARGQQLYDEDQKTIASYEDSGQIAHDVEKLRAICAPSLSNSQS